MRSLLRQVVLPALLSCLSALPSLAELAPIVTAPGVTLEKVGIYCRLEAEGREDAPETDLGYIQLLSGTPDFAFEQREVPARLGISFGILAMSDRDIPQARIEVYRPGTAKPDVWYSDFIAGAPAVRGFSFDFAHELVPGVWRFEAWDDKKQLYSVEFLVLPGSELPGVSSDCNLLA
jgi:hypothetical protein